MILTLRPGKPLMPVPPKGPCEAPQKDMLSMGEDADEVEHRPSPREQEKKTAPGFLCMLWLKLLDSIRGRLTYLLEKPQVGLKEK